MAAIDWSAVERVTFFKRDELTTDLVCCEIDGGTRQWLFHEEMRGWTVLQARLATLPGFRGDWFVHVSQPAFAASSFLAYAR
ncbi:hypothetical protein [Sphingomonas elodea]|uniref:hypothetical protein n=1 Tax=Sphingomonas elodea TaxID=179878 RepID=UPI0011101EDC|nr:hypothetical protein [Sphingomonas elodea]